MSNIVTGKKNIYGFKIGVIMLDMQFPRIPGDVGNAHTWNYPVLYRVVKDALPNKIAEDITDEDLAPFLNAARELEAQGVSAIALGCGFLSIFHARIKAAVKIPVIPSALALLPLIYRMLPPEKIVGVMTADATGLMPAHFKASGAQDVPVAIIGMEEEREFYTSVMQNKPQMDIDLCREEHKRVAQKLLRKNPQVGAILLECTNMPAYSQAIQEATGLPVFDITALIDFVHGALERKSFPLAL
ncbi:MAG: aspartate/glutamate racemase family protein [Anaerotruncus rubiinfantis]|jgi:Asp/Glu/hydantoin racemase|uniref:aspartate/glutamate racemase family protein n=1 Tax=Anaerotruncus rubiinfantis TaxID=1720200 RepID=UPI001897D086|nr:aspartate/glutamate racemase family protein [Anaerotruncus rubiinfantis]